MKVRIDADLCTGCGQCVENCPVVVPNEFDEGLSKRKGVYIPMNGQGVPMKAVIDDDACLYLKRGKCVQKCLEVCPTNAIHPTLSEALNNLFGAIDP